MRISSGDMNCPFLAFTGQPVAAAAASRSVWRQRMLTERGTFFGYNRLVTDFIGLGDMMALGVPVCFDATHSTQLPGGAGTATSGRPDRCEGLARAAVAAGVQALFLECHPDPARSRSDAGTVQPLSAVPALLAGLKRVRDAVQP